MTTYTILDGNGTPQTVTVPSLGQQLRAASTPVVLATEDSAVQGDPTDTAWASGNGSHTALLKTIAAAALDTSPSAITASSLPLPTGASTSANQTSVIGPVTPGTPATNSMLSGAIFNTTPATRTTGQQGPIEAGTVGSLKVELWAPGQVQSIPAVPDNADGTAVVTGPYRYTVMGRNTCFNGTTWDRMRGDVAGLVTQPYAMAGSRWSYAAAASGIVNTTTAVTIVAAAGAGVRNYCHSLQLSSDTLGAATEIAIRDGAAGTVLWRQKLQTASLPLQTIKFDPPLRGTANTLMEFVTLTASVTGAVYVDAQGYTSTV